MVLGGDMGELTPELKETMQYVYENDKRLITLVNDLLNVSRIDQKRIPYEPTLVDIIEVIKDTVRDLEAEGKRKNIRVLFDTTGNQTFPLTLDKKRFREVIENLMSNAVKYSRPDSEVKTTLSVLKDSVQIEVSDQGIGIPEKDKSNIFSKFFRADNALKSETEGTGLGLFVVKSFVENLGGTVWFESVENKGTTFFIKLPLSK
jgi:signal transduction histidine kinase